MRLRTFFLLGAFSFSWLAFVNCSSGQGTAFTYQGRLQSSGSPATGIYDFRFRLAGDPLGNSYVANPYLTNGVPVSNGLFSVTIDFGAGLLTGSNYWVEVDARTNGAGTYASLMPLQPLTPAPYAIFANTASNLSGALPAAQISGILSAANFSGVYGNPVILNNSGNSFSGDGSGLTGVNAAALNGMSSQNFWQLGGNNVNPGQFLGSTNNQPLEILVNGQRALHIESTPDTANFIAGWSNNYAAPGVVMGTVAGGGGVSIANGSLNTNAVWSSYGTVGGGLGNAAGTLNDDPSQVRGATVAGGANNTAGAHYSAVSGGTLNNVVLGADLSYIGGGYGNNIQTNAAYAGVGAGYQNSIYPNSSGSYIAGGYQNAIYGNAFGGGTSLSLSTIGGGGQNVIQYEASYSTIAGGNANSIQNNASAAAIGGGSGNSIQSYASDATVSGGIGNVVQGGASFSTVSGGHGNLIQTNSQHSTIGGGRANSINNATPYATIGGGDSNYVNGISGTVAGGEQNQATAFRDTVGGGLLNTASGGISTVAGGWTNTGSGNASAIGGGAFNVASGVGATIPGGSKNVASGTYSLASGQQAQALHDGTFVWADSQAPSFASTAPNQFDVRAGGGVQFVTSGAGMTLDGLPVVTSGVGDVNLGTYSSLPGGWANTIQSGADRSTISGGNGNQIGASIGATISGGVGCIIGTNATCSTISGGNYNTVLNNSAQDSIGGGLFNTNAGFASTVPGGYLNEALGNYSFAAGDQAQALHPGAFVWADSQGAPFASTSGDQFLLRARGGIGVDTASTPEGDLCINTNSYLFSHAMYLRGETGIDHNHGLAYCGSGHTNFSASVLPDGPVLWGFAGGALGVVSGGAHALLNWNSSSVNIGYSTDTQTAAPAMGVSGNRSQGYPLTLIHNLYPANILQAGPALRVINEGNSPDGALSVSTQGTGLIARFGNAATYVADIQTNGTIDAVVFNSTSDRNAKEAFAPVDEKQILEKVASLPVAEWSYKQAEGIRHIGPMAQDFQAAFKVGADDKHIATVDADGVALAAIKGLNEKLEAEAKQRDTEILALKTRLERLEQLLSAKLAREN